MRIRRLPLALLALLVTGALVAGCGSSDDKDSSGGSGGGGDKQDASALLRKAVSPANAVKSGELKITASADIKGDSEVKGPLKFTLGGPFAGQGKGKLPLLDWSLQASGMGQSFAGKLINTGDNAYIGFRGQTYEVGTALYKQFVSKYQKQASGSQPKSFADLGIQPEEWLTDTKVASGPSVGGDSTQEISGKVDTEKVLRDVVDLFKSPAVQKQLEGTGAKAPTISDSDIEKVKSAVVDPTLKIDVDGNDHLRRLAFTSDFKRPKGQTDGPTGGTIAFTFEYPKVGGTPDIKAPSGAKPIQLLMQQFGGGLGGRSSGGFQMN